MVTIDLRDQDLRGKSFRRDRLDGARLSRADLRGCDLRSASLRQADLKEVRTGMRLTGTLGVAALALAAAIAIGVATGFAGAYLRALLVSDQPLDAIVGLLMASALLVFLVASAWLGFSYAIRHVLGAFGALAAVTGVLAVAFGIGTGRGALSLVVFLVLCTVLVVLGSLARAVAGTASTSFFVVVAISGALAGRLAGGGLTALALAVAAMIVGRRALHGDRVHRWMAHWIARFACRYGTDFRGADLSGADFTHATIRACDFRGARLAQAHFDAAMITQSLFDPPGAPDTTPRDGAHATRRRPKRAPDARQQLPRPPP